MGTISIRARKLKTDVSDARHLYIVYEDDNGEKTVVRGGPTEGDVDGPVLGHLEVKHEPYKVVDGKKPPDWEEDGEKHSERVIEIPDEELKKKVVIIEKEVERINNGGYDYEIPFVETFIGDGVGDLNDQNSNTVVRAILKAIGLEDELDTFILEENIKAPGHMAKLEKNKGDRTLEDLVQKLLKSGKTALDFMKELALNLKKDLTWLLEKGAEFFKRITRAWLKAIGIDPNKPVTVLQESKTGRNLLFADQLSGRIMDRAGFVSLIEAGAYPGYRVSDINDIPTPVSIPDGREDNNLG